jgi:hypothetical protein
MVALVVVTLLPAPVAASSTASSMEMSIMTWVNRDRVARGLRPLRYHAPLRAIAGQRASNMAAVDILSHSVAGDLAGALDAYHVRYWAYGEAIGYTTATFGSTAASHLYRMWRASADHWRLLMSSRYNYIGVGIAYDGTTWGSVVLAEAADITPAIAHVTDHWRSGTTLSWSWSGRDPLLQNHTAGFRDFDVQYRADSGPWHLIMNDTGSHSIRLYHRSHGHSYTLRVRGTDRRGNIGAWSAGVRMFIP